MNLPEGLAVGVCSHTGLVRGGNEDDYLLAMPALSPVTHASSSPDSPSDDRSTDTDESRLVAAVADGMGGAAGGAEASRTALRALGAALLDVGTEPRADERMRLGFRLANTRVFESAAAVPALRDMGTTMTALWIEGDQAVFGHIGDSRLYRVRAGDVEALTVDHAVTEGESLLTRCIGGGQVACDSDDGRVELARGDRFVLCTDGVWNVVSASDFAAICRGRDAQETAEALVRRALDEGGPDNATALVLDVRDLGSVDRVDVPLPVHERPGARAMWPAPDSLRAPIWAWLVLTVALLLLAYATLRWLGIDALQVLFG